MHISFFPDRRVDGAQEVEADRSPSPTGSHSPVMDRNPSPPPETTGGDEDGDLDAIGDTVYSKHWLFSTLTRLINVRYYCLGFSLFFFLFRMRFSLKINKEIVEVGCMRIDRIKVDDLFADGHRALGDGNRRSDGAV